jgi:hypothetical protein
LEKKIIEELENIKRKKEIFKFYKHEYLSKIELDAKAWS